MELQAQCIMVSVKKKMWGMTEIVLSMCYQETNLMHFEYYLHRIGGKMKYEEL